MVLTESQQYSREEKFIDLIMGMESPILESEEQIDESALEFMSVVMEHFVENYKVPSLEESISMVISETEDPNAGLYEEIAEVMLDEGFADIIGKGISAIKHLALSSVARAKYKFADIRDKVNKDDLAASQQKLGSASAKLNLAKEKESIKNGGALSQAISTFKRARAETAVEKASKDVESKKALQADSGKKKDSAMGKLGAAVGNKNREVRKFKVATNTLRDKLVAKKDAAVGGVAKVKSAAIRAGAKMAVASQRTIGKAAGTVANKVASKVAGSEMAKAYKQVRNQ